MRKLTTFALATALLLAPLSALADKIADNMLLLQTASGGWSKQYKGVAVDYNRTFSAAEIAELQQPGRKDDATIDNKATTYEIGYLSTLYKTDKNAKYVAAAKRGVDYLLTAQYANGGWPQFYPDLSSYHHQITYNDDAMVRVLNLLQDISEGKGDTGALLRASHGARARQAVTKGLECVLATQVKIGGTLTIWGAQYDEVTLKPAKARAYELASLASSESVSIVRFLMRQPTPSAQIKTSVEAAARWFDTHRMRDLATKKIDDPTQETGQDVILVAQPGASLWARFYDLQNQRPLYANRDGKALTEYMQVPNERRVGYAWHGTWPDKLLKDDIPKWRTANGL
ncbi:pectate lyase [Xanthomonas arboricola]|uniref:pectate lyase n=1 Tax=Xanthomonas arboricola TaxID=56448 RepID=UPI000CEEF666|nr:pectate lyase [Xanthomonas arboricola]MBB4707897.1 PelA/Pel-15E family pectate lyase [Xanthomonas arboricola]PPT61746.1 pectate lyase [Xanthomonas arboricola]PPU10766.1 pectate lyase [Xanthomonas arboricola]